MSRVEEIYGLIVSTILGGIMILCVFSALFDALFEKDFRYIGGHGARGDMYVSP